MGSAESKVLDNAQATIDIACPAVDFVQQAQHSDNRMRLKPQVVVQQHEVGQHSTWLIDGGASCHVAGFDPENCLHNRRRASVEILVGGGQRLKCDCIGRQLRTLPHYPKDACISPGFNLISGPVWIRQDGLWPKVVEYLRRRTQGRLMQLSDLKGLYYLTNVRMDPSRTWTAAVAACLFRGERNFPANMDASNISAASQFFGSNRDSFQNQANQVKFCNLMLLAGRSHWQRGLAHASWCPLL